MNETSPIPWHQYALISYIAETLAPFEHFGKTAMQKLVYLMDLSGVPTGYRFQLYNYGPYCGDLASDVTYVETLGGVAIQFDPDRNVHRIAPGGQAHGLIEKAPQFLAQHRDSIDHVIRQFGKRSARDLELLATAAYLHDRFAENPAVQNALRSQVKAVKPKFNDTEVDAAIGELASEGYLK